jgi:hypothetical protein
MKKIIKGDKLVCIETVYNFLQQPLFIKDEVYEVLHNDGEVFLNHILYGNEYNSFPIEWVNKKFKKI